MTTQYNAKQSRWHEDFQLLAITFP